MRVVPVTLREANELVARWHRHHVRAQGHRFSLGLVDENDEPHGAAIIGRPVARMTDWRTTAEVTRLVTDGSPNACSMLYGASAKAAKAMGFEMIQTFILVSEPGISLRASGWTRDDRLGRGGSWSRDGRPRTDKHPIEAKVRWFKRLRGGQP